MKKFYAVSIIALSMSLGFTSCSSDDDSSSEEDEEGMTCVTCTMDNIADLTDGFGDLDLGGFGDLGELFEGLEGAEIEGADEEQTVCEGENGNAFIGDEDQGQTFADFIEGFELFGTCE